MAREHFGLRFYLSWLIVPISAFISSARKLWPSFWRIDASASVHLDDAVRIEVFDETGARMQAFRARALLHDLFRGGQFRLVNTAAA